MWEDFWEGFWEGFSGDYLEFKITAQFLYGKFFLFGWRDLKSGAMILWVLFWKGSFSRTLKDTEPCGNGVLVVFGGSKQ